MNNSGHQYDYIIAGAGAAGLSLAWKILQSPLKSKTILIVDAKLDPTNDKTWCFWDTTLPSFSDIIHKRWNQAEVSSFGNRFTQSLNDYTYYCLRSIDFKQKIIPALKKHSTIEFLQADITKLTSSSTGARLHTPDHSFKAEYIFQSCFTPPQLEQSPPHYPLLQHFLGWEIETQKPVLDESTFTLMDFDDTFSDGLAFIYLLPWSPQSALIEYTIFSKRTVEKAFYEDKISIYLNNRFNLKPIDYQINRREMGKIPMQDRPPIPWYKPYILNIGTSGGITKPSTGYTFKRIQNHTDAIIDNLLKDNNLSSAISFQKRYTAYDLWLLQIMHDNPRDASRVFNHLLKNNDLDRIFRFLSEETSFSEDLKIMNSVPYLPFLKAIWKTKDRLPELYSSPSTSEV